jgi:hypothetical protein
VQTGLSSLGQRLDSSLVIGNNYSVELRLSDTVVVVAVAGADVVAFQWCNYLATENCVGLPPGSPSHSSCFWTPCWNDEILASRCRNRD